MKNWLGEILGLQSMKDKRKSKSGRMAAGAMATLWLTICLVIAGTIEVLAATDTTSDMAMFEGVMVSPDGEAWTTDYMDRTGEQQMEGYTVLTGMPSELEPLEEGQHYYKGAKEGSVPVGRWEVHWSKAQCIHQFAAQNYHGIETSDGICEKYYNNGWIAYCADCEEPVAQMYVYGRKDTVQGITSMPAKSEYFYICPYCKGLEQGVSYQHLCKKVSYNYYKVSYEQNAPKDAQVQGYMASTKHMFNNAEEYEGQSAKRMGYGDTRLRRNRFSCKGYVFVGWNTRPDGTGKAFQEQEAVWNLSSTEGETIPLYAQWKKIQSTLVIDANGGTYHNQSLYQVTGYYNTRYELRQDFLIPASGYQVYFESNGGSAAAPIQTTKSFSHWEAKGSLYGSLQDNIYTFSDIEGVVDIIRARYADDVFILPDSEKENAVLVGWYKEASCSEQSFVGPPGAAVSVTKDTTLYAKWSTLVLWSRKDYQAYGGSGAVDLSWHQKETEGYYYKLYQSQNKKDWHEIYMAQQIGTAADVLETYGTAEQAVQRQIEHTGYYKLTASGAKGADYNDVLRGGNGGTVEAEYWLQKGDVLTFYPGSCGESVDNGESSDNKNQGILSKGGTNGNLASGGDATSLSGRGGGAATEIYVTREGVQSPLLIAGGGGGASIFFSGGAGGYGLTDIGERKGASSDYGGGGGGAQGGVVHTSYERTTIDNPDMADVAFKSNITRMFPQETVIYQAFENKSSYPEIKISAEEWERATGRIAVGELNKPLMTTRTNYVYDTDYEGTDGESHWGEYIYNEAGKDAPPHWNAYQILGGFCRTFTASYPTNGNTNVVVSGAIINSWGYHSDGDIRFRISDTKSGQVLYDVTYVSGGGFKAGDVYESKVLAWGDFDVTGAEEVTIEVYIKQVSWNGTQTDVGLYDTFFYGKWKESATGAEGGSSYCNMDFGCRNIHHTPGNHSTAGVAKLQSIDIGYQDSCALEDVRATDMAAPDPVTNYTVTVLADRQIQIVLEKPKDNGTVYYHRAESYKPAVDKAICSNLTEDTLTTGVMGYYYYVDKQPYGEVTAGHHYEAEDTWIVSATEGYLHIAPTDVAGNLGPTAHIKLEGKEAPIEISKKLFTEQMQLKDTEYVYPVGEKTYFVKADGVTEHCVVVNAGTEEAATKDYQVDSIFVHIADEMAEKWLKTTIPRGNIEQQQSSFANASLMMDVSPNWLGTIGIGGAQAMRTNHCRTISVEQSFTVEAEQSAFEVFPQAMATMEKETYYSPIEQDRELGLMLVPDGEAPVIEGMEELASLDVLDMTLQKKAFFLKAYDTGSGLREFTVMVRNRDNYMQQSFSCDVEGELYLEIDKDNPLFIGDIVISAFAMDNVSNACIIGEDGLTFTLETQLFRERNPQEQIFKAGDGAVLEIKTSGYVERIEVEFPEEMLAVLPELNQVYEYETPSLRNTERLNFSVPLGIAGTQYEIMVKAYKNGEMLISKPTMIVVEGTVLDELHTRIRNNG